MQRSERNGDRRLKDDMQEHAAGVMMMMSVDTTTRQISNTNQLIQVWWNQAMQCSKRRDRDLVVDPLW